MVNHKRASLILLLFLLVGPLCGFGQQEPPILSIGQIDDLKPVTAILPDPYRSLSPEEALNSSYYQAYGSVSLDDGISSYWLKIRLTNPRGDSSFRYMGHGDSNGKIRVFVKRKNTPLQLVDSTGLDVPFDRRSVDVGAIAMSRIFVRPMDTLTLLVHVNNSWTLSRQLFGYTFEFFKLYGPQEFYSQFKRPHMFNIFFYGAIITMLFYNLMLTVFLKDITYLCYVGFVFLFLSYSSVTDGTALELIFSNYPSVDLALRILTAPILMITYLIFSRLYLDVDTFFPRLKRMFYVNIALLLSTYVFFYFDIWWHGRTLLMAMVVISAVFMVVTSILSVRSGYKPAWFFLAANLLLLTSGCVYVLYISTAIPHNQYTRFIDFGPQAASVLELSIFSLGLAYRIKMAEDELIKNKIEKEHEKQLLIEEKNRELEIKVWERTKEIEQQKQEIQVNNDQLEEKVSDRTRRLNVAYNELVILNQELDSFMYRAAHDIKGPLTTILGLCILAAKEENPKLLKNYISILEKHSHESIALLRRIMSISDIKNEPLKKVPVDFNQLQLEVLQKISQIPQSTQVVIQFEIEPGLRMNSDVKLLESILTNLIDNAIKFRNKLAESVCRVSIYTSEGKVCMEISDNGVGIDAELRDRLFEMFFRGSEFDSGSGLGLYLSKLAVRKLGGIIYHLDTPDHTVFKIELPS